MGPPEALEEICWNHHPCPIPTSGKKEPTFTISPCPPQVKGFPGDTASPTFPGCFCMHAEQVPKGIPHPSIRGTGAGIGSCKGGCRQVSLGQNQWLLQQCPQAMNAQTVPNTGANETLSPAQVKHFITGPNSRSHVIDHFQSLSTPDS